MGQFCGDLNTKLVLYLNGRKKDRCQMVKCHLNTGQPDHLNTGQMDAILNLLHNLLGGTKCDDLDRSAIGPA